MNISRESINDNDERFTFYDSFESYIDSVNHEFDKYSDSSAQKQYYVNEYENNRAFIYGNYPQNETFEELNNAKYDFIDQPALSEVLENTKELFATIDLGGAFKKDRLVATAKAIGVFSFDLASKGLYRPMEYYSEELDETVDPNLVKRIKDGVFVTERKIRGGGTKTYFLKQQQTGTACVNKKKHYANDLIAEGYSKTEAHKKANKKFKGCKIKFATRTKKVYLTRLGKTLSAEKQGKDRFVDVFVTIGGSGGQDAKEIIYNVLPSMLLAYFLDRANIKVRIIGLDQGVRHSWGAPDLGTKYYITGYLVKDYGDELNWNRVAKLTSDPRMFRWTMFKNSLINWTAFKPDDNSSSIGGVIYAETYKKMLERYKRWYIEQTKNNSLRNENTRLMLASQYIARGSEERMVEGAIEEFFRLIDAVDLEYNGAKIALPRIRDREQKLNNDLNTIRQRLMGTINDTTFVEASTSKYSMTDNDIAFAYDLRDRLRKDLNTVFRNT
jgi:hypothetical protein